MTDIPFIYRDFYDVPRAILIQYQGKQLFLNSAFDREKDDYPPNYQCYVLPDLSESQVEGSWDSFTDIAQKHIGSVSLNNLIFDDTKRCWIDSGAIDRLFASENNKGQY